MSQTNPPSKLMHMLFLKQTIAFLLLVIFVAGGAMAWQTMVREDNPDLNIPQAVITTEWGGAAPEQIEKEVTQELEKKLNGMKGLKRYDSGSFNSYSITTVEFEADEDVAAAMNLLRAKVDEAQAEFPSAVKKPKIEQVSVSNSPIITYMLYGDLAAENLQRAAKALKDRLEQVSGVQEVEIAGERETTVYVRMYPERLRALGLSPAQVKNRLQGANLDSAWGNYEADTFNIELYFAARFDNLEQLRQIAISRLAPDRIVRLGEVALVEKRLEKADVLTSFSGQGDEYRDGVAIQIKKRPGADSVKIINIVKANMEEAKGLPLWPHGMKSYITSDQSERINESFNDIFTNIWQAMLAVFIILLFLLTWREATIAGLAIPVTLLAALLIVWGTGSTLNNMVIIGMVLALGMLVDVFILVMEGMHEAIYNRKLRFAEAAIHTVKTFAKPAFAGQLTTILALTPLLAIGGVDGKFIRLIPITTVACLIASFIIAFALCIPLSRYLLGRNKGSNELTFMDRVTNFLGKKLYNWLKVVPLAGRFTAFLWTIGAVALLYVSLMAVGKLPVQMYPKDDGRNLGVLVELAPSTTLKQAEGVAELAAEYLRKQPYLDNVTQYVGQKSPLSSASLKEALLPNEASNYIGFSAIFLPRDQRDREGYQYLPELKAGLEKALEHIPGSRILFTPETGGSSTDDPIQIRLSGDDMNYLADLSQKVQVALRSVPGATDVRDNLGAFRAQVRFEPKQEALSFHGLSESDLAEQIRFATEFDEVGKFKVEGVSDDYDLRLGTYWYSRGHEIEGPRYFDELSNLKITTQSGEVIPLGSLVSYKLTQVPQVFVHTKGVRTVTVLSKTEGRTALEILAVIQPTLDEMKKDWPTGYDYSFGGEAESTEETFGAMGIAFMAAIFLVFAVLTILFDSFKQPLIILSTIPMALIGVFGGFFLFGFPFSFPAVIGLVTLVGIVVNNAIVMVETINTHRKTGMEVREAAARSASDRLRPIVGTTITTVAGLLPLALSNAMWFPLCMAVMFGLMFSTIVSLVLVPTLFFLLERDKPAELIEVAA